LETTLSLGSMKAKILRKEDLESAHRKSRGEFPKVIFVRAVAAHSYPVLISHPRPAIDKDFRIGGDSVAETALGIINCCLDRYGNNSRVAAGCLRLLEYRINMTFRVMVG